MNLFILDELKKTLKEGSIPHLRFPKKTLEFKKTNEKSDISIKNEKIHSQEPKTVLLKLVTKIMRSS